VYLCGRVTIPYVYEEYYCISVAMTGVLLAVPTGFGIASSMLAVAIAKTAETS
jgi:hypothetical protein